MPNIILPEHGTTTAMTCTLASLANGSARQTTLINNTNVAQMVRCYYKLTTGTSPTVDTFIEIYALFGDGAIRTDNAGATDAAITITGAWLLRAVKVSATSNVTYRGSFLLMNPGIEWGLAVKNETDVALNSTAGNHALYYVTENVEVQST